MGDIQMDDGGTKGKASGLLPTEDEEGAAESRTRKQAKPLAE
jgi:hypothetical protein